MVNPAIHRGDLDALAGVRYSADGRVTVGCLGVDQRYAGVQIRLVGVVRVNHFYPWQGHQSPAGFIEIDLAWLNRQTVEEDLVSQSQADAFFVGVAGLICARQGSLHG